MVALIIDQMAAMGTAPASADELQTRKAVLIGNFGRTIETTDGLANLLGAYVEQGVPLDELQRYTGAVRAVDGTAEQSAAAALLDPAPASIVVVGDAKQFIDPLRRAHPTLTVIPAATVKLDGAALQ